MMADSPGGSEHFLHGGVVVPTGELEAIGTVDCRGFCTGTLITDSLVLTAGHCSCRRRNNGCINRASFTFMDVLPVGSQVRRNVTIAGDVEIYPGFDAGGFLLNDFALIHLDRPASALIQNIVPIPVERPTNRPEVGDTATLVGFGHAESDCSSPIGVKRKAMVDVDEISDITIRFNDNNVFVCKGDSGGPALNSQGRIIGVCSTGRSEPGQSNYDPTYVAYDWIHPETLSVRRLAGDCLDLEPPISIMDDIFDDETIFSLYGRLKAIHHNCQ